MAIVYEQINGSSIPDGALAALKERRATIVTTNHPTISHFPFSATRGLCGFEIEEDVSYAIRAHETNDEAIRNATTCDRCRRIVWRGA